MFKTIFGHKIITGIVIITLAGGGYYEYKNIKGNTIETRYVLAAAEKGTLITSVSGSGQISVTNQVDVKSKASGDLTAVNIKNGQEVKAGAVIASINSSDAVKTVRDAENSLESAKLALEKLKKPADSYSLLQAENAIKTAKAGLEKLKKPVDSYSLLQAENAVANAKDSLKKLKLSQESDLKTAEETKQKADDNLVKAYEDAFNAISNAFIDLSNVITQLYNILYSADIAASGITEGHGQYSGSYNSFVLYNTTDADFKDKIDDFQITAETDYKAARAKYDANLENFKKATRYSDSKTVTALLSETLEATKAIAQAAKSENNFLDAWVDYRTEKKLEIFTKVTTHQTNLDTYSGTVNSHISSLLSIQNTIQTNLDSITSAERSLKEMEQNNPLDIAASESSIKEKEAALKKLKDDPDPLDIAAAEMSIKEKEAALVKLKDDPDPLDIKTQELTIEQRKNALKDAQEKLADYSVHAPFDGVIASVAVKKGDSISSGGTIATLVTKQKNAAISLNEVDMAKVKIGQKTTITFDAIDGLEITGEVAEIDTLGTVSQGVVTYNVKIIFDTQDERVKSGMSLSASIITEVKQDVVMVPNSAIKTQGDIYYVETLANSPSSSSQLSANANNNTEIASVLPPVQKPVEIGLANDSMTEIVSGLKEGDQIITRTVTGAQTTTTAGKNNSLFRIPGVGGGPPRD